MKAQVRWRKGSLSGANSNCVEASHHLDAIRDSKNPSTILPGDVRRLLHALKADTIAR